MKSKRSSFFGRWLWRLNVIFIVALCLAYVGVRVSPETFWPLAFFSLAYPFLLLINSAFLLLWFFSKKRRRALIVGATILIGWNTLFNFVQVIPRAAADDGSRVMSYNVRLFDLYNWSENTKTKDKIVDLFKRENVDILCLQEYFDSGEDGYLITVDELLQQTGYSGIHDAYSQHTKNDHHFGIATLTNYPILDKGIVPLSNELDNMCIWTDLAMQGDTVRIYNAHLASIHFGAADYAFIQELDAEEHIKDLKVLGDLGRVTNLLQVAFKKRARQVAEIKQHMENCSYPIIYAGDLNDSPTSYAYAQLTENLTDAFISSGSGIGSTYIGVFPSFRIDHIMHSDELESTGYVTLEDQLSDHNAISCTVKLKN